MNGFRLPGHVHRHVTAARAFHTDLVAHAQRRLRVLIDLAKYLDALRSQNTSLAEKVSAAESSRRHLAALEQLGRSSRETYSDFQRAVRRVHHHLKRLRTIGREPTDEPSESVAGAFRAEADGRRRRGA